MKKQVKKSTLKDVAGRAGVSLTTASQAINNILSARINKSTRERIIKAAEFLNYQANKVAKSLSDGKTGIIGFAISGFMEPLFSTSFFSELIRGVGAGLDECGLKLLLLHPGREDDPVQLYRETIGTGFLDGIIMEGNFIGDEFVLRLEKEDYPYILIGRELLNKKVKYVKLDYFNGSFQAVNHLVNLGHRNIGFIGGTSSEKVTNLMEREKGFIYALEKNSIKPVPDIIVRGECLNDYEGYKCMQKILKSKIKPTAIIAAHDSLAIGAMNAIKDKKIKIPEDIAVTGFDDIPEASMVRPALTTVQYPLFDLGRTSAILMHELLIKENNNISIKKVLPTKLVIRESCGGKII